MALVAKVSSRVGKRKGRGYSLEELEKAGLTKAIAGKLKIPVDTRRKTAYDENIKALSKLELPEIKPKTKKKPRKKAQKAEKPKAKALSSAEKIKAIEAEKERKIKAAMTKAKAGKKKKAPAKKPKKAAPKKPAKTKAAPKKK